MKHRSIGLLLAVLLIVSMLPGAVRAADAGRVRVIVENTAMREESYQGHQVPWKDLLFDQEIDFKAGMTADSALREAAAAYLMGVLPVEQFLTYDEGALIGVGGLLNWGTGAWLASVNDWIAPLGTRLQAGDTVRIQYTVSRGRDVGADPSSTDKGLRALTFDVGSLYPSFSKDVTDYTLYVPAALERVTILPTAANRNLRVLVSEGGAATERWGARSVSVGCGTAAVQAEGGKTYTVRLVPVAEPTPAPTPTPTASPKPTPCDGGQSCPSRVFADVDRAGWYHLAVDWAVTSGVTKGVSATAFGPGVSCSRAQMVTFLWRAAGSAEPKQSANPFTDVPAGTFYTKAVLWAVEKGLTTGTDKTHFSPDAAVTRGQTVTFLWRLEQQPAPKGSGGFSDVSASAYYAKAIAWAVENGITNGVGGGKFAPDNDCTRAQIVTFLWRDLTGGEKAYALAADTPLDGAMARLLETVPAPQCGRDDFAVFDAARNAAEAGRALPQAYYDYLADVQTKAAVGSSLGAADAKTLAGTVLAVTALGRNAADLGGADLTERLNDRRFVAASGVSGPIWALLALDSGGYPSYCRADYVQAILAAQGEDGSLGGDTALTAQALQALTPYLAEAGVLRAVNAALRYLSGQQQPGGGFPADDLNATAQTMLAVQSLSTQRINANTAQIAPGFFVKTDGEQVSTLQSHLLTFRRADGSFGQDNELALRALIAEQCKALDVMVCIVR